MNFVNAILSRKIYVFICFLFLVLIAFGSAISGDFFFDDKSLIVDNEFIRSFSHFFDWFTTNSRSGAGLEVGNLYRPLQTMVNAIMFHVFGLNAEFYHLLNILIHAVNGLLVYTLFSRFSFSKIVSALMAVVFLIHPVQVESVAYIAGLPDLLVALFVLLGLSLYVSEIGGWKRILTLLIVVVLGFLSKESMVVFFPLALLIDIFRWKEYGAGEKSVRKKILGVFAGMTFLFVILKFTALSFTGNLGLSYESNIYTDNLHVRIFTFISVLVEYVKLIFWPLELYFEKGKGLFGSLATLQGFLGVIIVVGGLVAAALSFRKKKVFFLAYLWFFINLAPVSGLVPQNAMYAEHWLYLTIIGVLILFAALYDSLESGFWKKVFVVGLCVISVLFIIRDVDRSRQWADPFAFFENELQYSEAPHEIHNKVGTLYFEQEDYASAMVEFEKGINLSDTNAEARFNMCLSYYLTGKLGAALSNCERAVQIDPELSNSYMLLYNIYVMTENLERAENVMKILNSMEVTLPNQ